MRTGAETNARPNPTAPCTTEPTKTAEMAIAISSQFTGEASKFGRKIDCVFFSGGPNSLFYH
ncbi:uncharacterized protein METZ01_LOCUS1758 [marine metagenome]|uniref:Uncharacterized protein n=1 Tax=marine metagenome TaxID=408172 RepID=A0A381N4B5_9ZZZZ